MPDPNEPRKNGDTLTVDQLLKRANVQTVSSPPARDAEKAPPQNGAFMRDGKMFYRYDMDGDIIVTHKPIEQMTEQDFYDAPIEMMQDNSSGRLPANLTVRFKDPQYVGHWFNKKAGGGARIGTAHALNFVPAKKEDLEWCSKHLLDTDGAIEQGGDLVLFKIHKAQLFKYFKQSLEKAKKLGGIEGYKNKAQSTLSPANMDRSPYYFGPQATQEFQGIGPVANLPVVENK
jgi:hypothetical protein